MKKIIPALLSALLASVFPFQVQASGTDRILKSSFEENSLNMYINTSDSTMTPYAVAVDGSEISISVCRKAGAEDNIHTVFLADSHSAADEKSKEFFLSLIRECLRNSEENESFSLISFSDKGIVTESEFTDNQMKILDAAENISFSEEKSDLGMAFSELEKINQSENFSGFERAVIFTGSEAINSPGSPVADISIPAYFVIAEPESSMIMSENISELSCFQNLYVCSSEEETGRAAGMINDFSDIIFLSAETDEDIVGTGGLKRISVSLQGENISSVVEGSADFGEHRYDSSEKTVKSLRILVVIVTAIAVLLASVLAVLLRKNRKAFSAGEKIPDEPSCVTAPLAVKTAVNSGTASTVVLKREPVFRLLLSRTDVPGNVIELQKDSELIIGRNQSMADCIIYNERSVSQRHCRIFSRNSRFYVEDLGSLNHTFVDDEEIQSAAELYSGSVLKVGRVKFDVKIVPV